MAIKLLTKAYSPRCLSLIVRLLKVKFHGRMPLVAYLWGVAAYRLQHHGIETYKFFFNRKDAMTLYHV